jgi:hypothetical protein
MKVLGAMVRLISEKWKWFSMVNMDMTIQKATLCLFGRVYSRVIELGLRLYVL